MGFLKFVFSKTFLKHFVLSIIIVAVLIAAVFVWLHFYTNHGKSVIVPDTYGLNEAQVKRIFSNSKLRYEIIDSVHTDDVPMGTIYEQIPAAGSKVKNHRKIFLIQNAYTRRMVAMPDIKDLSLRQASTVIQSAKLKITDTIYVPSEFENLVIGQLHGGVEIQPGEKIEEGSGIDIIVANGLSSETTPVPDLKGMLVTDALKLLTQKGLNIGTAVRDTEISDTASIDSLLIYGQKPQSNSLLNIGSMVTIWITNDSLKLIPDSSEVIN